MSTAHQAGTPQVSGWVGWVAFGAVMMMMAGAFNIINGLAAVFTDDIYITGSEGVLLLDVTAWGWIHIVTGILVAGVGFALLRGALWARVVGTVLVMLNMATHVLLMAAYPWWSLLIIALDVVILWAIIVHGEEAQYT
jgi:hypothetical protein